MTSKSKKDKIKQGNQRDFDLLYDVLVNGGTYSDYRSELLDRSMPQEQQNFNISEDDILAAWILGKDEESELYARGGHIHQKLPWILNPNNKGIGWLLRNLNQNSFTSGSYNSTTAPKVDTGLQGSTNNFSNDLGVYTLIVSGVADVIGNSVGAAKDIDYGKYDAYLNLIGSYKPGFSTDTSFMMNEWNQMPQFTNVSYEDAGGHSGELVATNIGKSMLSGATAGAALGSVVPVIGTAIGAVGGALLGGISQGIGEWRNSINAKKNQDYINTVGGIKAELNPIKFGYTFTLANKLGILKQLSQPYMAACGGKMKNRLASGGYINSHYDYITDPLVKVNAGGTHQENPNEGVLTSIAPDGQPNLVEEGETIINNGLEDAYVFSDRIVADEEILKSHLLPVKFAGKTYADISKELDKIIEEHKNDEISKRTFDEMINRLQQAQEDLKYQEKAEEVAKFIDGLSDEEKEQLEQTMVEEAQAEQQAAEEQAIAEQQAQELAAQEQQIQPEQAPEQVAMEQPEELIVPSRYDQMMSRALFADAADLGMFAQGGHLHQPGNRIELSIARTNRRPIHGKWNGLYDWMFNNEPLVLQTEEEPVNYSSNRFIGSSYNNQSPNVYEPDDRGRLIIGNAINTDNGNRVAYYSVDGNQHPFRESQMDSDGKYIGKVRNNPVTPDLSLLAYDKLVGYDQGRNETMEIALGRYGKDKIKPNTLSTNQQSSLYGTMNSSGIKPTQNTKPSVNTIIPDTNTEETTPYSNPHRPDYSIFGQYIPNDLDPNWKPNRLTPYEINGSVIGYTDPLGKFVPIGGYSDYGDTVNSVVNEINEANASTNSSDTDSSITSSDGDKSGNDKPTTDWSTYLRYAPAIGSGIQYLSDLFGITNRNDYTNPNLLQRSINAIPNVGFTPLGGYRTFNPFDETFQLNALRSMNEAARRAVINNSNGNYGAAMAALNALNYNEGSQFGDLALKAREYNEKERQAIDEYNLKINQINSSLSMSAQEKNQAIAALKARLTAALAEMRQQIEDTNDAAKSANMTNFYQNLGNVGKESFNMTMVRSNPAFYYTITDDGHILYKNGFDGLNERDQAFVRSVAEPQAEEQRKKRLEEANKKADDATNKQSDFGLLIGGRNPFSRYSSFGNFGNS